MCIHFFLNKKICLKIITRSWPITFPVVFQCRIPIKNETISQDIRMYYAFSYVIYLEYNGTQNIRLNKLSDNTLLIFRHCHLTSHKHSSFKLYAYELFPSNSYFSLSCQESRRLRAIREYRCNATIQGLSISMIIYIVIK